MNPFLFKQPVKNDLLRREVRRERSDWASKPIEKYTVTKKKTLFTTVVINRKSSPNGQHIKPPGGCATRRKSHWVLLFVTQEQESKVTVGKTSPELDSWRLGDDLTFGQSDSEVETDTNISMRQTLAVLPSRKQLSNNNDKTWKLGLHDASFHDHHYIYSAANSLIWLVTKCWSTY